MQYFKNQGFINYDFGGLKSGEMYISHQMDGLDFFKRSFGGDVILHYQYRKYNSRFIKLLFRSYNFLQTRIWFLLSSPKNSIRNYTETVTHRNLPVRLPPLSNSPFPAESPSKTGFLSVQYRVRSHYKTSAAKWLVLIVFQKNFIFWKYFCWILNFVYIFVVHYYLPLFLSCSISKNMAKNTKCNPINKRRIESVARVNIESSNAILR